MSLFRDYCFLPVKLVIRVIINGVTVKQPPGKHSDSYTRTRMREHGVCFISADPFAAPGFLATVSFYSLMKYDT